MNLENGTHKILFQHLEMKECLMIKLNISSFRKCFSQKNQFVLSRFFKISVPTENISDLRSLTEKTYHKNNK